MASDDSNDQNSEKHRSQLLEARAKLTHRLEALERDASTALEKNFAEQAIELENRDVLLALGKEARAELAKIEHALERIGTGRYGICERCGEPIAADRLDAYPATSRCFACASG